jgi:hypothetical protein
MRYWTVCIFVFTAMMAGCDDNVVPRVSQPSIDGLTLADLQPAVIEKPAPVMLFMVTTFLVDAERAASVRSCYESLPQGGIRFLDKKAFEANGFFASIGTGMQVGDVDRCLSQMGAEQYGRANFVLDAGTEMPFSEAFINEERTISYVAAGGGSESVLLHYGTLGWMLTVRPDTTSPGRVHVRVQPVFTPRGLLNWPGAERYAKKMEHRIEAGRFDVSLREADFVVLGVGCDSIEEMTPLEQLLFLHSGRKDKMRLYVIMCVKAEG